MADVTSFENVPLENGNHVPRSSPAILGNKKTLGTRVRKWISVNFSTNFHRDWLLCHSWFNLSIVILLPDFETVHALCVRAILSVRKSGQGLSAKQFPLLRIIF